LTLCTKFTLKIDRDREVGSALRTIAPRDVVNVIQPFHVHGNKKTKEKLLAKITHYSYITSVLGHLKGC
jgi:hypothetical protein